MPGSRRSGDEDHAVGLEDRLLELAQRLGLEAQPGHVEHQVVLVEEAHDDLLAIDRRQHRDAEVEVLDAVLDLGLDLDPAVLRKALLGDVELGQDLDAAGDRLAQPQRRVHHLVEDAVDPVADAVVLLVRLDVDVRGALLDRVGEDDVHQADDRRFLGLLLQHLEVEILVLVEHFERGVRRGVGEVLHDLLELDGVRRAVVLVDRDAQRGFRGDHGIDVVPRHELDVVHGEDVGRVDHRQGHFGADLGDRKDGVLARDVGRDHLDDRFVDLDALQVDRGDPEVLGKELDEVLLRHGADLHQRRADAPALLLLQGEPLLQLLRADLAGLEEGVSQAVTHLSNGLSWLKTELSRKSQDPLWRDRPDCIPV